MGKVDFKMRSKDNKNKWKKIILLTSIEGWEENNDIQKELKKLGSYFDSENLNDKKQSIINSVKRNKNQDNFYNVTTTNNFYDFEDFNKQLIKEISERFSVSKIELQKLTGASRATVDKLYSGEFLPKNTQVKGLEKLFNIQFYTVERVEELDKKVIFS